MSVSGAEHYMSRWHQDDNSIKTNCPKSLCGKLEKIIFLKFTGAVMAKRCCAGGNFMAIMMRICLRENNPLAPLMSLVFVVTMLSGHTQWLSLERGQGHTVIS